MPFHVSRGCRLHFETLGEGRAVLLLHGFTNYGMAWTPQLPALVHAGYRAILPDLAGHGLSAPADAITAVPDLAADVVALLDHLGIERAVLCGLSLGGMVAQQAAVDVPGRVEALVVADSRPNADTPELAAAVAGWIALFEQPDGPRKRLAATWPQLVNEDFRESPSGRAALQAWEAVLARIPGTSLCNVARGMTRFNVIDRLAAVAVPTLVISGARDRLIAPAQSCATADLIPGAEFRIIPGAGHISNLDSPAEFNDLLIRFLERL
jgi:3-oxoadipate enol-lactonase